MASVAGVSPINYSPIERKEIAPSKISPLRVELIFKEHQENHAGVTGLEILDGSRFITGSNDRSIKTWERTSNKSLSTQYVDSQYRIWHMQLLSGNVCVAIGWSPADPGKNSIRIYNSIDGKFHDLMKHSGDITSFAVSKQGLLASGSYDWSAKIWEPFSSQNLHTYGSGAIVHCVGFLPDGKTFVCGNQKGEIQFWEITQDKPDSRKPDKVFHNPCPLSSLLVMQDGKIATGSIDGVVRIWDSSEIPEKALKKELRGHFEYVSALAERPDHILVSGSGDKRMILWDTDTGESWASPQEHTNKIHAVAVFDDNSVLTGSLDGTVKLWTVIPAARL